MLLKLIFARLSDQHPWLG